MSCEPISEQEQGRTSTLRAQDNSATKEGRCALPHSNIEAQRDVRSDKGSEPKDSHLTCRPKSPTASDCLTSEEEEVAKKGPKQGRKVGRPILYTGDPHAPGLTSLERRTMVRRLANRESARRVRLRRQDHLQQLEDEVNLLREANIGLSVQNESLQNDRDGRRRDHSGAPRTALVPASSTQEGTGFHEETWRNTGNSGTKSEISQYSGSAEWDGCFKLIPPDFPGPGGLPNASTKGADL